MKPTKTGIIKYANRKLYDQKKGRYTTLEEVFEQAFVTADSYRIPMITDHKTGADVTDEVLAQFVVKAIASKKAKFARGYLLAALLPVRRAA